MATRAHNGLLLKSQQQNPLNWPVTAVGQAPPPNQKEFIANLASTET